GPWPPAQMLAEYEQHFPGWGNRMLELTERQVAHRHEMERKQVDRAENRMDRGQHFGFIMGGLAVLAAAATLIFAPASWSTSFAACVLVAVGVGGPTVARVFATKFNWPSSRASERVGGDRQNLPTPR